MKKLNIAIIIVLAALFVLLVAYMGDNADLTDNSGKTMHFNVSSGPSELSNVINRIKTSPDYKGYDVETIKWMESLGNKRVFFGNGAIVIMDSINAAKIPKDPGITDVYIYNLFTAKVIENHDLGNDYPTVYYVKNVNFIEQEIIGTGLA